MMHLFSRTPLRETILKYDHHTKLHVHNAAIAIWSLVNAQIGFHCNYLNARDSDSNLVARECTNRFSLRLFECKG